MIKSSRLFFFFGCSVLSIVSCGALKNITAPDYSKDVQITFKGIGWGAGEDLTINETGMATKKLVNEETEERKLQISENEHQKLLMNFKDFHKLKSNYDSNSCNDTPDYKITCSKQNGEQKTVHCNSCEFMVNAEDSDIKLLSKIVQDLSNLDARVYKDGKP